MHYSISCVLYPQDPFVSLVSGSDVTVPENISTVMVCAEISNVIPASGLENDIMVTFGIEDGVKAGMYT